MRVISVMLFAMAVTLTAQNPVPNAPVKPSTSLSVTGCLQKTQTEAYTLTNSEGKRYQLRTVNPEIKFAEHVDQRVTITAASATEAAKEDEQGLLDVVALVVQSGSCKP
jgi:hypothetical protein